MKKYYQKKRRKNKIRYDRVAFLFGLVVIIILSVVLLWHKETKDPFDKKAVWISYLNMESLKDQEEEVFKEKFTQMCQKVKEQKLNTMIVHVRPFMDAVYQSKLFPVSPYIASKNHLDYDPLTLMVNIAHENDLALEAWINPYRISYNKEQLTYFIKNAAISNWLYTDKILLNNTTAMLNPNNEEVRSYIVAGVKEIIDNYDVDGIHMDDYFYRNDLFGNTTMEERQNAVNLLVKEIYQCIKNKDEQLSFGISPQGNLDNARNIGADIDTWLSEEGYVDYVMPQIYWTDNWSADGSIEMFSSRVEAYSNLHTNSSKLYCGLALYLSGQEVADDAGWSMYHDNLKRQTAILKEKGWSGYALFDYDSLENSNAQEELNNLIQ